MENTHPNCPSVDINHRFISSKLEFDLIMADKPGLFTILTGGILKGMQTTMKHLFRRRITLEYPSTKKEMTPRFRGTLGMNQDPETGQAKCVGCGICVRQCPDKLFLLETHRDEEGKRQVDLLKVYAGGCMFCGICAEKCPYDAVVFTTMYETATANKKNLTLTLVKGGKVGV